MKILITGANGFIGTHLCKALTHAGHEVVACVRSIHPSDIDSSLRRRPESTSPLALDDKWIPAFAGMTGVDESEQAVENSSPAPLNDTIIQTGDLATFDGWEDALQGVDAVVHLAGRVHQTSKQAAQNSDAFHQANVVATQRLVEACAVHGVQQCVFLSTIAVMGYDSGDAPFQPTDAPQPFNPYSHSKAEAEAIISSSSLDWSIIRIPLVYGAGVRANFLSLARMVRKRVPLPLALVKNQRSVVYVGNVVDAIMQSLSCEAAHGQVLHIADKAPLSSPALICAIAKALGVKPRLLPVPPFLMRMATRALRKKMLYHKLCGNLALETATTNNLLDWQPPYSTEEGLRETFSSFKP